MSMPTEGQTPTTRDNLVIGGYVAAALILVGSLGPWGTVFGISVAGTEGDGVITLILAILAAAGVFLTTTAVDGKPRFKAQWLTIVFAAISALIGIIDFLDISSSDGVSPGWGLWLVLLASIALTVVGVLLMRRLKTAA